MIALYICLGCAAVVALAVCFIVFSNNFLTVTNQKIVLSGITKAVKIVHISDLHGKRFGKDNGRLLKKIIDIAPDYICITGDIIHKSVSNTHIRAHETTLHIV